LHGFEILDEIQVDDRLAGLIRCMKDLRNAKLHAFAGKKSRVPKLSMTGGQVRYIFTVAAIVLASCLLPDD
jgi:hypothetical protein